MASIAHELFESIFASGVDNHSAAVQLLDQMIQSQKVEAEFLEYKGADKISDADVKYYWSKALSAFADSGGGVLIWGINCKTIKNPITKVDEDFPDRFAPQPQAYRLKALLNSWLVGATDNVVENVSIRHVLTHGDHGCVVCYIPEGANKPYRALFADHLYYMRLPDRMEKIPHSLLRAMFLPHLTPKLQVEVRMYTAYQIGGADQDLRFEFVVKNVGGVTARDTFIRIESQEPMTEIAFHGAEWNAKHDEVMVSTKEYYRFKYLSSAPIHPTFVQGLVTYQWRGTRRLDTRLWFKIMVYPENGEPLILEAKFTDFSARVGKDEIIAAPVIPKTE